MSDDLFRGALVRLAAPRPEDAAIIASWSESSRYPRLVDTDLAVPRTPGELGRATVRAGDSLEFRLRTLEGDTLVGFVALFGIEWNNRCATVAIGIGDPAHRRKGYARDGMQLLLRYAFTEANLERVGLDVIAYNEPAIALYRSLGFQQEGVRRRAVLRAGRAYDRIDFGLLREEWARPLRNP
ncbi:GNAT family N-acetyltransferase [Sandaracinus amylolyticus]|uniref:Acetyltransferase, GNAT family n=1 Tax=Sandaracinus amylolyticus TaxID=927083 RepID=A0A0F6W9B8_9BACT|nr:GNAT family protein [Sandaracinus amylolyticus]AKF10768.1 acetyltransferase, GNAT family [Sandaracinus amylolyticus]